MTEPSFDRPTLTNEEQKELVAVAMKINGIFDRGKRAQYIMAICIENLTLLKEVNQHRQVRGFAQLKIHDRDISRIG